jgi:1-acyl-sn-glycerol-3-phosphate acyltransferase
MPRTTRSAETPGLPLAGWIAAYRALEPAWRSMWPGVLEGEGRLPDHRRYLVVANHSGLGVTECVSLIGAWLSRFGTTRPLAAMAHSALFKLPGMSEALRGFGCVEATREGAAWARANDVPILLFPGGDHESMRPLWQARRVDFAGRRGWIRVAREHDLSIVPLAITGSHVTLPNLGGAKALSWMTGTRALGMRRGPLPVLSVAAALASLRFTRGAAPTRRAITALASFWAVALVPWVPGKLTFEILPELDIRGLDDDAVYRRVVSALEHQVRSRPVWERVGSD